MFCFVLWKLKFFPTFFCKSISGCFSGFWQICWCLNFENWVDQCFRWKKKSFRNALIVPFWLFGVSFSFIFFSFFSKAQRNRATESGNPPFSLKGRQQVNVEVFFFFWMLRSSRTKIFLWSPNPIFFQLQCKILLSFSKELFCFVLFFLYY